jgi:hypothetical protein
MHIVPCNDAVHLVCNDLKVHAEWENGSCSSSQSDTFHRDDAIVLQLAWITFANFLGEIHFTPKKGKTVQSSRQVYFACKGRFVGVNMACLECDLAFNMIQKVCYEGESRSWNWDKHCSKFHMQNCMIAHH